MLAVAAGLLGWNLGGGSVLSSDDALYAEMAREMARSGGWLEPTWMGAVVFEKPPLLLWLLALSGSLLGWSEAALRLPGLLGGLVAVFYAARLAEAAVAHAPRVVRRATPLLVALLCTGSVLFTMTVRRPLTDPLLAGAVMASLWYGSRVARGVGGRRKAVGLGLAGGLGVLAKQAAMGPAALVVLAALVAHRRWRGLGLAAGVALLVAAPWHLAMTARHGAAFWDVYVGYHVAARAGASLVGASDPTYYLQVLAEQDAAMALLLGAGLVAGTVALRYRAAPQRLPLLLAVATAWLTLALAQASSTRLFHYLLPVVPLAAVATVGGLGTWLARSPMAGLLGLWGLLAYVGGPLDPHVLAPDYSPGARLLGTAIAREAPPSSRLVVWEAYDPALAWYADRPAVFWVGPDEVYARLHGIDMLRRSDAVVQASPEALAALVATPGRVDVVAPFDRPEGLRELVDAAERVRPVRFRRDEAARRFHVVLEPRG